MVSYLRSSGHASEPPTRQTGEHVPFSFADDLRDCTQPVRVTLGGLEYPGEVIVAGRWRAAFGRPLSGVSMFRLVLLHSPNAPSPDAIVDDRICVAAPRVRGERISGYQGRLFVGSPGEKPERPGPAWTGPEGIRYRFPAQGPANVCQRQ